MIKLFSKLFRQAQSPLPFDIEKAVGHYLLTLPRCTNRVLVVGRRYLDRRYSYEMTVDTASLTDWAKRYETSSLQVNNPDQAIELALLLWLRGADLSDSSVSLPPEIFFKVLRGYQTNFLGMAGTEVYCHECGQIIGDVSMKSTRLPVREIFDIWKYEWHCPQGHLLYQDEIEMNGGVSRPVAQNVYDEKVLSIPAFLRKYNPVEKRR